MFTKNKFLNTKTIVSIVLLLAWAGIIFSFSAKPAPVSKAQSSTVVEVIKTVISHINTNASKNDHIWINAETITRKFAHFSIYFVLGFLALNCSKNLFKNKKNIIYAVIFCILYAASDEFHQRFVPGRGCMGFDVVIDSFGSCLGILLYYFAILRRIILRQRSS